jgi:small subunit ribosomal protein S15
MHILQCCVIIVLCKCVKEINLDKEKKSAVIADFKVHDGDTGSTEVQVALLTERINQLYASKKDIKNYRSLISRLGLRK